MEGEHVRAAVSYSPNRYLETDKLIPGETCRVKFSFHYKYGDTQTISCVKDVTILPNSPHVESVIPLNANQIRVGFSDSVSNASVGLPDHYLILDENGKQILIKSVEGSGLKDTTDFVILNLYEPVAERAKLTVETTEGILRFSDSEAVLPYCYTVVLSDRTAPGIERVVWDNDGTYFTSVTVCFSEPVLSGTILIDNVPSGTAGGDAVTVSGLQLDGSRSHQISVEDVSDGVNTDRYGGCFSVARLYDPPKTETVPPAVERVDFTKDATGRVISFIITYDEDLLPSVPTGHIYAFDENGNPVYTEQWGRDPDGNPIASYQIFCTSTVLPLDGRKAVFTIADGVDLYNGQYTIVLPAGLVTDTQYNDSVEQTITIDFSST